MSPPRASIIRFEGAFGALGATLVTLAFVFSRAGIPPWIPPAVLVRFGVASPLTGMTRSFVALAQGDVHAAFAWHPLGPFCFIAAAAAPVYAVAALASGRRFRWPARALGTRAFGWTTAIVFALAWVRQIKEVGV